MHAGAFPSFDVVLVNFFLQYVYNIFGSFQKTHELINMSKVYESKNGLWTFITFAKKQPKDSDDSKGLTNQSKQPLLYNQ